MTDSPVPSGSARPARALDIISVAFVALLLISNIAATKAFMVGSSSHYLIFDGGAILFPLTYIIGDVLSEVYGFARARRVIIMGFVASFLASLTFFVVQYLPPAPDYQNQDAFAAVLGVVWRAVLASLVGYLAGQLLNSYVLVWIRRKWGAKHLWARLIGSYDRRRGRGHDPVLHDPVLRRDDAGQLHQLHGDRVLLQGAPRGRSSPRHLSGDRGRSVAARA